MSSPRSIECILRKHQDLILSLNLPDVLSASSAEVTISQTPYVSHLELLAIANELPTIRKNLQKYTKHRKYGELMEVASHVQDAVDEYLFVNENMIDKYDAINDATPTATEEIIQNEENEPTAHTEESEDNLTMLRQRLLAGGTHTSLDDAGPNINKANDYHELIQEDIMNELTGLASSLRASALSFSSKLLEDHKGLDKTSDAMYKNETLMRQVGGNLNNYVTNKTGGKISLWFLLKVTVGVYLLFFAMVLIVKIFPKL